MSLRTRIAVVCLLFLRIVGATGWVASRSEAALGDVAVGMYDDSFRGMMYASQARTDFTRYQADPADRSVLPAIVERRKVAAAQSRSPPAPAPARR